MTWLEHARMSLTAPIFLVGDDDVRSSNTALPCASESVSMSGEEVALVELQAPGGPSSSRRPRSSPFHSTFNGQTSCRPARSQNRPSARRRRILAVTRRDGWRTGRCPPFARDLPFDLPTDVRSTTAATVPSPMPALEPPKSGWQPGGDHLGLFTVSDWASTVAVVVPSPGHGRWSRGRLADEPLCALIPRKTVPLRPSIPLTCDRDRRRFVIVGAPNFLVEHARKRPLGPSRSPLDGRPGNLGLQHRAWEGAAALFFPPPEP